MKTKTKPAKSRKAPAPAYTKVSMAEAKNRLTELIRSGKNTIIQRHGTPAAAIIPFEDEDDFIDWLYNTDPEFRKAHEAAVQADLKEHRAGKTVPIKEAMKRMGL